MQTGPGGRKFLNLQGFLERPMNPGSQKRKPVAATRQPGRAAETSADDLTPVEIQEQLETVLASETFQRAERLSRFLRYVVEQSLAGQEKTLKEYSIGLHVFDKPESFDTRVDPIVRVEAGRLRAKIRDYYDGEGSNDPVWLGLRKRGYSPAFHRRKAEAPPAADPQSPDHPGRAPRSDPRVIAVLPFEDLSPEKKQEYFCDGMTQEIISALAKIEGLSVTARTSAAQFKGKPEDVREIARQLRVGRVLEGSVQKIGRQVRISAHLLDAATGFDCWAETYDRPLEDVLAIQDEISQAIAQALRAEAEAESGTDHAVKRPPEASKAHNRYLKALDHWDKRTEEEIKKAIACFREAVREDQHYAPAYAGLANSYIALALSEALPPRVAMTQASECARQALAIDDQLAEAHTAQGTIRALYDWDWAGAEQALHGAMKLNPHLATAPHWLALVCLLPTGRLDEALETFQLALERDPTSVTINTHLGLLLYMRREYDKAIRQFQLAADLGPNFYEAHWGLGRAYIQSRRFDEALACFRRTLELASGRTSAIAALAYCHARMQDRQKARQLLQELEQLSAATYVSPYSFAKIQTGLGDPYAALEWLEKAEEDHSPRLTWIKVDPVVDPLRDDPRFQKLLQRVGLSQGSVEATAVQAV
jgi:TolB-like protein/Tfp pilus assembly protein PilF